MGYLDQIKATMDEHGLMYKMVTTTRPGEATTIVEDNPDCDICVAVGGDGTVNEVARGILSRGKGILAIIPGGTGNDLGKSLAIEENLDEALKKLIQCKTMEIDLGKAKDKFFFNISSLGFDSEVVRHTDKIKRFVKGKAAYILGVITALIVYRSRRVVFEVDGKHIERKATLVAVGNGRYYGGGMMILPMAKVDDGLLDVCVVKDISNLRILTLFPTIFKGDHVKYDKYVEFHTAKKIIVRAEGSYLLNIDGELFEIKNEEVEFKLADERLSVIC
ncbi:diacylglycerol kinase family lipid kinase [Gudongella oleilytica]|uniref:diacylglycerol/lipid kinase family protein n=1 Tax=Gudongella oleilytica TaxID=1582259 RepID=UPI002A35FE77|nr:diacylglycerol kinase family lipid kinase [Gudongella oleilytica]MDY0257772.1 diacylglycerol kinase family lipid kinase [Gudongella oleilytica]